MFERFTQRARRCVFFARYEANQTGSSEIGPVHFLLAIIREHKSMVSHFLLPDWDMDLFRDIVLGISPKSSGNDPQTDLGFSKESKSLLANACEISDKHGDKFIGSSHLFIALLEQQESPASKLLVESGVSLEAVRNDAVRLFETISKQ